MSIVTQALRPKHHTHVFVLLRAMLLGLPLLCGFGCSDPVKPWDRQPEAQALPPTSTGGEVTVRGLVLMEFVPGVKAGDRGVLTGSVEVFDRPLDVELLTQKLRAGQCRSGNALLDQRPVLLRGLRLGEASVKTGPMTWPLSLGQVDVPGNKPSFIARLAKREVLPPYGQIVDVSMQAGGDLPAAFGASTRFPQDVRLTIDGSGEEAVSLKRDENLILRWLQSNQSKNVWLRIEQNDRLRRVLRTLDCHVVPGKDKALSPSLLRAFDHDDTGKLTRLSLITETYKNATLQGFDFPVLLRMRVIRTVPLRLLPQ